MHSAVSAIKQALASLDLKHSPMADRKFVQDSLPRVQLHTEKMRRNEAVVQHVQSWMEPGSMPNPADIIRLFECLERLVRLMEYSFSRILWPMLIYAEQYVRATRLVRRSELFQVLVVAVCLAMKMWEDYGPDLDLTAEVCGITKKQISNMERLFLEKLNFQLKLEEADVEAFKAMPMRTAAGCA